MVKGPRKQFKSIELLSKAALRNNVFPDTKVVKPSMNSLRRVCKDWTGHVVGQYMNELQASGSMQTLPW